MDPNEALRIIRDLCQYVIDEAYDDDGDWRGENTIAGFAVDLADEISALDNWIVNGGFLPADWVK